MAIKLDVHDKSVGSNARLSCSNVARGFLNAFSLESPEAREMKRREKVRCELVKSQFGVGRNGDTAPLIDRIGQMLHLD